MGKLLWNHKMLMLMLTVPIFSVSAHRGVAQKVHVRSVSHTRTQPHNHTHTHLLSCLHAHTHEYTQTQTSSVHGRGDFVTWHRIVITTFNSSRFVICAYSVYTALLAWRTVEAAKATPPRSFCCWIAGQRRSVLEGLRCPKANMFGCWLVTDVCVCN